MQTDDQIQQFPTATTSETLAVYRLSDRSSYPPIVPAKADRYWMDIKFGGWPNRCLPLLIANQNGWMILNEHDVEITWNGNAGLDALKFEFPKGRQSTTPQSMFGGGIVTWTFPYLFRTPPGINLWVRGPANDPKPAIAPLEGIVETDWLPYTFTMNWQITRPGKTVKFEKDEPICFITPVRRHEAENLHPVIKNLDSEPALKADYDAWHARRLQGIAKSGPEGTQGEKAVADQGQYIRGERLDGKRVSEHQTKLRISAFEELEPAPPTTDLPKEEKPRNSGILGKLFGR